MRALPLVILAGAAFAVGAVLASGSPELDAAKRFADAWRAKDYETMYAQLNPASKSAISEKDFADQYERAREMATLQSIDVGDVRGPVDVNGTDQVAVELVTTTDSFGTLGGELAIPVADGGVAWSSDLVFPGLHTGETLDRTTKAPQRAPILAADGSALAEGPANARTTNGAGGIVTGDVGQASPEQAKELEARGFPRETPTGTSGLELAFDEQLAGTPGGRLLAVSESGKRVIAKSKPIPGKPVKTTIDPEVEQVAADALGSQYGGVAVLDATTGDVRALAGLGFSAPQPPGSTMKIITASAALEDGVATLDSTYPVQTSAFVGGREIANAHGELCGGTLIQSFAESCNSVFAPLGVDIGGDRFVQTAEDFGFNSPPSLYNDEAIQRVDPAQSSLPKQLTDDAEIGASAIGQGEVLATPLEMASVAQTIGNGGTREPTNIVKDPALRSSQQPVKVISPETADEVKQMMIEVVKSGTGTAGAIPEAQVAAKTGTAELGTYQDTSTTAQPEHNVDAWFSAFAPADEPKYAVAVMIVNASGDGGVVAAPIASQILSGIL